MRKIKAISFVVTLLFLCIHQIRAQECDRLQNASPAELTTFLNNIATSQENAPCITFAINELGRKNYKPAIPILTKLLEFRRPPTQREKDGLYLHIQGVSEIYPAANALEEIGDKALPSVLNVIKADSTSVIARENAVAVWMEIYKYESSQGVAMLKQEVNKTENSNAKQNLIWALHKALAWCNPPDKGLCEAAAGLGSAN